jgi:hypothetical protein
VDDLLLHGEEVGELLRGGLGESRLAPQLGRQEAVRLLQREVRSLGVGGYEWTRLESKGLETRRSRFRFEGG